MKVDVYWNSNERCFSVRSREKENYGKVIAHLDTVYIEDAEFVVQNAGRNKVLETGVKNVHAFIRGDMKNHFSLNRRPGTLVIYNPYDTGRFTSFKGDIVESAKFVLCSTRAKKPVVAACEIQYQTNEPNLV